MESTELAERPARKGTKSCAECRRRKLRCDWPSKESQICRRCDERGCECMAQTFYVKPPNPHKLSSRQRIQLLENKVASLVKAVNVDGKTSPESSSAQDTPGTHAGSADHDFGDETQSSGSDSDEAVPDNKPPHLSALFENDWLSIDSDRQEHPHQNRAAKSIDRLLHLARLALDKLIPSREQVAALAAYEGTSKGFYFMEVQFPEPWMLNSQEAVLDHYDSMRQSGVNTYSLAFWLVAVSKLAYQMSAEPLAPDRLTTKMSQKLYDLPKIVTKTIEHKILRHDKLLSCPEGIGLAMLSVRLHIFRGNFQKGWLLLRRAIAMSELIGLPTMARIAQKTSGTGTGLASPDFPHDPVLSKAYLWESLLDLDKLCGTMLNLPAATHTYEPQLPRPLLVDGVVQDRAYLSRLANLSVQTQYVDNWRVCSVSRATLYPTVLELDKQLRELTLEVPATWWVAPISAVDPRHIIHYWQKYVAMRIHLPFTLDRTPEPVYWYSHLAGIDACKTLLMRYETLRKNLPATFFLGRLMDVQAFTASVILLLTSQNRPAACTLYLESGPGSPSVKDMVDRTIALMEMKSHDVQGTINFGKVGSATIRALCDLFHTSPDDTSAQQELTLKVPLLGTIRVRRKQLDESPGASACEMRPPEVPAVLPAATSGTDELPLQPPQNASADAGLMNALSSRDWDPQWEPFSWFVVDNFDASFQDALMADVGGEDWDFPPF